MLETNDIKAPHQGQKVYAAGRLPAEADAAMILIHGRGDSAPSILGLARVLDHEDLAYLAPQAAGNSWYPYSFLAPIERNEPRLSSGLQAIAEVLAYVESAGIPVDKVIISGFSQGACLASEFVARNARRYGGLVAFSGGLVGPPGHLRDYEGSLDGTPVFMGCSNNDAHIPEDRVHESAAVFERLGAQVIKRIYPNMGHTIIQDELDYAREIIQALVTGGHNPARVPDAAERRS